MQKNVKIFIFFLYIMAGSCVEAFDKKLLLLDNNDLTVERCLFIKSWSTVYKDCSLKQLGISDLNVFLSELFDQEEHDYKNKNKKRLFFHVCNDDQMIGYISFELYKEHAVYVKQFAIVPERCNVETFKDLIFGIFDYIESVSCVHIDLNVMATCYLDMVKDLGFVDQKQTQDATTISLRMLFNRCGTCPCEIDDDDDENDYQDPFEYRFGNDPEAVAFELELDNDNDY